VSGHVADHMGIMGDAGSTGIPGPTICLGRGSGGDIGGQKTNKGWRPNKITVNGTSSGTTVSAGASMSIAVAKWARQSARLDGGVQFWCDAVARAVRR
jgi:hypothetical protein